MGDPQAPQIQTAKAQAGMIPFQPVAYADPIMFPNGLDVIVTQPGKVAPEGMAHLPRGVMIVAFPPDVSAQIMHNITIELGKPQPGQVKPPGIEY